jgi:acyl-CoA synthetase (AMP-forming)/AMP-acid ligase II/acyl carrier protein
MTPTPLAALLHEGATTFGSSPALLGPGGLRLSHRTLHEVVRSIGADLRGAGIEPGTRIVTCVPAGFDDALALLVAAAHGSLVPVDPGTTASELHALRRDVLPSAIVTVSGSAISRALGPSTTTIRSPSGTTLDVHRLDRPAPVDTEPLVILSTSGSTGRSKRVPQSQRGLVTAARDLEACFGLTPRDRNIACAPLFHGNGLFVGFLPALVSGGSIASPGRFEPTAFLRGLEALSPTWFTAVPTQVHALLRVGEPMASHSLRFVRVGSAHLPSHARLELESLLGVPVICGYGAAEAAHITSQRVPPTGDRDGVGAPCGNEVMVVDPSGTRLAPGRTGEVWVRGASVVRGYLGDAPDKGSFEGGWWRTGDLGAFDDEGSLTLSGRVKHTINRGGETIAAKEIETVLMSHPAVSEAVVLGVPHPTLGEDLAAAVVLRNGKPSASALRDHVRAHLPASKVPSRIEAVDALPVTSTGKVRVDDVRDALTTTPTALPPVGELEAGIARAVGDVLGLASIPANHHFLDLGGDSLSATRLLAKLERRLGITLDHAGLLGLGTVQAIARGAPSRAEPQTTIADWTPRGADRGPASTCEAAVWLGHLMGSDAAFNVQSVIDLRGPLDEQALRAAVADLIARHAALRTGFALAGDRLCRREVQAVDVSDVLSVEPSSLSDEALRRLAEAELDRPFDPSTPPLVRMQLARSGPRHAALILTLHHVVTDGPSMDVIARDLGALYDAHTGGVRRLERLEHTAGDAARWQEAYRETDAFADSLAFWSERLRDAPRRIDWPGAPAPSGIRRAVRRTMRANLQVPPHGVRTTAFLFMQSAWKLVVAALSNAQDLTFAAPVSARPGAAYDDVVGCFVEALPFRSRLSGEEHFSAFVARETEAAFRAYAHNQGAVTDVLAAARPRGESPVFGRPPFSVIFSSDEVQADVDFGAALTARRTPSARGVPPYDLAIYVRTFPGERTDVELVADTGVLPRERVESMLAELETVVDAIRADPNRRVGDLLARAALDLV